MEGESLPFGLWLKRQRRALDLTQEELAQQIGCALVTLRKIETGERRPSKPILERLAVILSHSSGRAAGVHGLCTRGLPRRRPFTARRGHRHPRPRTPWQTSERPVRADNLPLQLTSFIGREREVAEVRRLLGETRLLTLTGSGGAGKTRLALQAAAGLLSEFEDGVWWVELASLTDPALVPQAIGSALGLRDEAKRPLLDQLGDHLCGKRLLLVLDNCEHLIAACATCANVLLHAAPDLRILVTSREPLAIAGETTYRVPSLQVPDPEHLPPPADLAQCRSGPAVRRARGRGAAGFRRDGGQRGGDRRDLPAPGRHPVGHRAGRCAHQGAVGRGAAGPAGRPVPGADGRQPGRAAAPPDAARDHGLELRAAGRTGTDPIAPAGGVCGRLDPGGRRGGLWRGWPPGGGGAGSPRGPGRQIAGDPGMAR